MTRGSSLVVSLHRVGRRLAARLQAVAFWTAICLPLAYVPLFVGDTAGTELIVGVVVLHVLSVLLGHFHHAGPLGDGAVSPARAPSREEGY